MKKNKGIVIIVSAPSGAGKSTLCSYLVNKMPGLRYSISYTTRPPRKGERNRVNYYFITETEFKSMIKKQIFAEWALVHGHYYGTSRPGLDKIINSGRDAILDIDVQGALKIKKAYRDAVMIFVMTPSWKILEKRLKARKKDEKYVIEKRLKNAKWELGFINKYEYLVLNDKIKTAAENIKSVIVSEKHKMRRMSKIKF